MKRILAGLFLCSLATAATIPPESGARPGVVRIWASEPMREVVTRWVAGVRAAHPQLRIESAFPGTDVAIAGLPSGKCDIALLGREATPTEIKAFEWPFHYKPTRVELMTGGIDRPGTSPALVVFVHRESSVASLTLAQLDAIVGVERRRGAPAELRIWGDLGVTGPQAARPIHVYLPDTETGTGRYFRAAVLGDSRKLHWERIQEFTEDATTRDTERKTLTALARDPDGLAAASFIDAMPAGLKAVPLAVADGQPPIAPDGPSVASRTYPLSRAIIAYVNRQPNQPVNSDVQAFLEYVLSGAGIEDVAADRGYLPLSAEACAAQLRKLQ